MHDMNFFAPFKTKKGRPKEGMLFRILTGMLIAAMIIAPATLYGLMSRINIQIDNIKAELNMPKNVELMKSLGVKRDLLNASNIAVTELKSSTTYVKSEQWFNEVLLKSLVDTLPKQVALSDLSISALTVSEIDGENIIQKNLNGFVISGMATDRPAVAEFVYNIRQSGVFRDIFVNQISGLPGEYSFSAQFFVRDGEAQ